MVDPEIRKVILRFVNALTAKGIRVEKVVLYGSYAHGKNHLDSDVDLAIISPDFGHDRFEERKMLAGYALSSTCAMMNNIARICVSQHISRVCKNVSR